MKEFEICRQRTPEEDDAVMDAEWRRIGYPAHIETLRVTKEFDAAYEVYAKLDQVRGVLDDPYHANTPTGQDILSVLDGRARERT